MTSGLGLLIGHLQVAASNAKIYCLSIGAITMTFPLDFFQQPRLLWRRAALLPARLHHHRLRCTYRPKRSKPVPAVLYLARR